MGWEVDFATVKVYRWAAGTLLSCFSWCAVLVLVGGVSEYQAATACLAGCLHACFYCTVQSPRASVMVYEWHGTHVVVVFFLIYGRFIAFLIGCWMSEVNSPQVW